MAQRIGKCTNYSGCKLVIRSREQDGEAPLFASSPNSLSVPSQQKIGVGIPEAV
jgi:hypothetical protein